MKNNKKRLIFKFKYIIWSTNNKNSILSYFTTSLFITISFILFLLNCNNFSHVKILGKKGIKRKRERTQNKNKNKNKPHHH